jgi:hypothetical protein
MTNKPKIGRDTSKNTGNMGKGRPKGAVNKSTRTFRDTINKLLDENAENVSLWLSQVAVDDPAKALDLISKLAEYAAPKLSRTEHTGEDGGPVEMVCKWQD